MEIVCRICEVLPLQHVDFIGRESGQKGVLKKKTFALRHGDQRFFAEAQGLLAELLETNGHLVAGMLVVADIRLFSREYLTKEQQRGWSTDVILKSIAEL